MKNNLTIYPMTDNDIDRVCSINNLSFCTPWSYESIKNDLHNKFSYYIVVKYNNEVIGYAGLWFIIDEADITNIAIHPDFRGLGGGSKLMSALIDLCIKYKIPSLTLEVRKSNIIAQNLYKKFGFIEEGIRKKYYDGIEDAIIMWKRDIL